MNDWVPQVLVHCRLNHIFLKKTPPQGMLLAALFFFRKTVCALNWVCIRSVMFTLKTLECSKQAIACFVGFWNWSNDWERQLGAFIFGCQRWNSSIYERRTTAKVFAKIVFINQEQKLEDQRTIRYRPSSNHKWYQLGIRGFYRMTPLGPYGERIDGRAPPGVASHTDILRLVTRSSDKPNNVCVEGYTRSGACGVIWLNTHQV